MPFSSLEDALIACVYKKQVLVDEYFFRTESEAQEAGELFKKIGNPYISGRAVRADYYDADYELHLFAAFYYPSAR